MPELPEVETVRRELAKRIIGKQLGVPVIYFRKVVQSDYEQYLSLINGKTIVDVKRKGKFLLLDLDEKFNILFHLRMEGKLYVVDKEKHSLKHLSLFIPFVNDKEGLAFYDVRKFGVTYLLKKKESGPLSNIGKEPFEIEDAKEVLDLYSSSTHCLKELLLDQSKMCGLGNIYADEVCFASRLSPFKKGNTLTLEDCQKILENSKIILQKAIDSQGSTIRTYQASQDTHGSFQDFLQVYGREGKECRSCHTLKIEKRKLNGRGTSLCPCCQKAGLNLAITGKIASGKSLATSYFKEAGFAVFSCDDYIHSLYNDKNFLLKLKDAFPEVFTPNLNKKKIGKLLAESKTFKRRYLSFLYQKLKIAINDFIIQEDGKDKVFEVPVLFDAHMEKLFTFLIGCEAKDQLSHLLERGDKNPEQRLSFNALNSYDKYRYKLDYILHSDSTKEDLRNQVLQVIENIKERIPS